MLYRSIASHLAWSESVQAIAVSDVAVSWNWVGVSENGAHKEPSFAGCMTFRQTWWWWYRWLSEIERVCQPLRRRRKHPDAVLGENGFLYVVGNKSVWRIPPRRRSWTENLCVSVNTRILLQCLVCKDECRNYSYCYVEGTDKYISFSFQTVTQRLFEPLTKVNWGLTPRPHLSRLTLPLE